MLRVNLYVLRKRNIADVALQRALKGLAAAVREVGIQGKLRLIERRTQGADHLRIAHGYGTGGEQVRALHNTHVAIGRHGVPVREIERKIVGARRDHFHREGVHPGHHAIRDIELEAAVHAGHLRGIGQEPAVQPDVGAVIDGIEIQPQALAAEVAAQHHLRAVPPGNDIRVIGWRRIDQKIVARIVQRAGQRLKVEVVSRIGIDLVFDQRVEHGGG